MRIFFILLLMLIASCSSYQLPDQQQPVSIAIGEPRVAYGDYVGLAIGAPGTLAVVSGCAVFSGRSVIWRKGTRFSAAENAFIMSSGASYPLGKRITIMGSTVTSIDHLTVSWDQPKPCPGPWFIAS